MDDSAAAPDAMPMLVRSDIAAAERHALAIVDPWERAQALAWVARYAAEDEVTRLARLSLDAAASCDDAYRQATGAAWIVRALLERGRRDEALLMLEMALHGVPRIATALGRSDALFLLLQAAFAVGEDVRRSLVFALAEAQDNDSHWRIARNYEEALAMLQAVDPEFVHTMARGGDEAQRQRLGAALAVGAREPRTFFW